MLRLAEVRPDDVVFDLGCGDGRIAIAAARDHGALGVCIDIDPKRSSESRANAEAAGVSERVTVRTEDLFQAEIRSATVVTLFLWPKINLRLRPKLLAELAPGTRVVSYMHDMGDWKPEKTVHVGVDGRTYPIYLWRIPGRAAP